MSEPRPLFEIVCFDVDSTLSSLEGIDVLAGDDPRVVELTERAMAGELPIEEVYGKRLDLVRPDIGAIESLAQRYRETLVPGMERLVKDLIDSDVDVHLVTAGIEQAVLPLAAHLGIPSRAVHAVSLKFDENGAYVGYDEAAPTSKAGGKRIVARNIRVRNKGRMAFVGDGGTDLETRDVVDLFVGFGVVASRDKVRQGADVFVDSGGGDALRPYLFGEGG